MSVLAAGYGRMGFPRGWPSNNDRDLAVSITVAVLTMKAASLPAGLEVCFSSAVDGSHFHTSTAPSSLMAAADGVPFSSLERQYGCSLVAGSLELGASPFPPTRLSPFDPRGASTDADADFLQLYSGSVDC